MIKRYAIIRRFLWMIAIGAMGAACSSCVTPSEDRPQPNIILIIGDDISVDDFGCYGHPNIRTPNVDKLAANGLRFSNAYLTISQCSPTRCSVITGRYPHNTGAPELHMDLPEGQVMFPAILKKAGYYTAAAGKWHMGDYAKNAFDEVVASKPGGEERWVQLLQQRPKDKPFFMWFASLDAHRSWQPDEDGKPHALEDAVIPPYLIDTPAVREDMAKYYDEIQRLDRYTGKVVSELKNQGVLENSIIIFMADNGRPFPRCKMRLYDSGIKTPLIIHWPDGLKKGQVSHSLVSAIDIAPTILELAGLKSPETIQGISMMPVLAEPKTAIRKYVFAEHNWHAQTAHERMVRQGDYVYIRNAYPQLPQISCIDRQCPQKELRKWAKTGKLTPAQMDPLLEPRPSEELFNLSEDPLQITNIAENPECRNVLEDLRKIMDEWQSRTGDTTPSLDKASPDRNDRKTGKLLYKRGINPRGIFPGQTTEASKINDPGPR